ncbi:MAG: AI-2E family transporter, partial [Candidatus Neomarinimicrobiota bacterium]
MDKSVNSPSGQINKTIWRIFFILLGMAFFWLVYPYIKVVFFMLIISWLLAMILNPVVDYFESIRINRGLAIVIVMVIILGSVIGIVALVVPAIMSAIESLTTKLDSDLIKNLTIQLEKFFQDNFNNAALARDVISKLEQVGGEMIVNIGRVLKNVSSYVAFIGIVPFVTFFLIKDKRLFKRMLISQIPNRYFELFLNVLHKVGDQVTKYIQGQAIDA